MAGEAASIGSNDGGVKMAVVVGADRFHNQSLQSPESLANTVEDLGAAITALETRLANVSAGLANQLQGVEDRADHATRRLAMEVVEMGEALSRRIRAQPTSAAIPSVAAPLQGLIKPVTVGLSGALLAALAALAWVLSHPPTAASGAAVSEPAVAALYAPSGDAEAPVAPKPIHAAVRHRPHFAARHPAHIKHAATPPPAPLPDTLPGSGAHSVLGPSPG